MTNKNPSSTPVNACTRTDVRVIKSLFVSLCTSVPVDTRLSLLQKSSNEVKFLIALHPRVSSFSHRKRNSLRHPALAMATKQYYFVEKLHQHQFQPNDEDESTDLNNSLHSSGTEHVRGNTLNSIDEALAGFSKRDGFHPVMGMHSTPSSVSMEQVSSYSLGEEAHLGRRKSVDSLSTDRRVSNVFSLLLKEGMQQTERGGLNAHGGKKYHSSALTILRASNSKLGHLNYGDFPALKIACKNFVNLFFRHVDKFSLSSPLTRGMGGFSDLPHSPGSATRAQGRKAGNRLHAQGSKKLGSLNGWDPLHKQGPRIDKGRSGLLVSNIDDEIDDEELSALRAEEDARWKHISDCYDQILRVSSSTCKPAAIAAGMNDCVNCMVRRFWDRITVSSAEIDSYNNTKLFPMNTVRRSTVTNEGKTRGSVKRGSDRTPRKSTTSIQGHRKGRGTSMLNRPSSRGRDKQKASSASPTKAMDGGRTKNTASSNKSSSLAPVAQFMTPLQYIYLNLRIAHTILPSTAFAESGADTEIELLEAVVEDLITDSNHLPGHSKRDMFFGFVPTPTLFSPEAGKLDLAATMSSHSQSSVLGSPYFVHLSSDNISNHSISEYTMLGQEGGARDSAERPTAEAFFSSWDLSALPVLTYPQFWSSMMELVDNWTCTAVNPAECAVFLLGLYMDVFAHDWGKDDDKMFSFLKESKESLASFGLHDDGDDLFGDSVTQELQRESEGMINSFNEILKVLETMDSSDSDVLVEQFLNPSQRGRLSRELGIKQKPETFLTEMGKERKMTGPGLAADDMVELLAASGSSSTSLIDWTGHTKQDGWRYLKVHDPESDSVVYLRRKTMRLSELEGKRSASDNSVKWGASGETAKKRSSMKPPRERGSEEEGSKLVYVLEYLSGAERGKVYRRRRFTRRLQGDLQTTAGPSHRGSGSALIKLQAYRAFTELRSPWEEIEMPPKRIRRFEGLQREEGFVDEAFQDNVTWSSYTNSSGDSDSDDGEGSGSEEMEGMPKIMGDERYRQRRRRRRVIRSAKRGERRSYDQPRRSSQVRFTLDDDTDSDISHSEMLRYLRSASGVDLELPADDLSQTKTPESKTIAEESVSSLTKAQRAELRERKSWLQGILSSQSVNIPDRVFSDPNHEPLLYELLKKTEEAIERRQKTIEASQNGKSPDSLAASAGLIDITDLDLALLGKLFSKPDFYSLDELRSTDLMRRLMALDDDEGTQRSGSAPPTTDQMNDILAALHRRGFTRGHRFETESEQRKREKLRAEIERIKAEELEKKLASAKSVLERDGIEKESKKWSKSEDDTAVATPRVYSGPASTLPPLASPFVDPSLSTPSTEGPLLLLHGLQRTATPVDAFGRKATLSSSQSLHRRRPPSGSLDLPTPLTKEERQEQEKLFREFEQFCVAQASEHGKYRITPFTTYTEAQLEAFFAHLYLGPPQQALLRGRAPLAAPTSIAGGGMWHQAIGDDGEGEGKGKKMGRTPVKPSGVAEGGRRPAPPVAAKPLVKEQFVLGSATTTRRVPVGAAAGSRKDASSLLPPILQPAPVKVFTLTRSDNVRDAIRDTYVNYVDDKTYHESLNAGPHPPVGSMYNSNTKNKRKS